MPDHAARAALCEARGDWDGCLTEWRRAVAEARASTIPASGAGSTTFELTEGWLRQAEARAASRGASADLS